MRMLIRILLVLVVIVAAAAGFWYYRSHNAPAGGSAAQGSSSTAARTFTQLVAVKKGNLSSNLTVVGQLEAVQNADLTFSRMSGSAKLATLAVKAGNTVTNG